jgi:hypothetical protein
MRVNRVAQKRPWEMVRNLGSPALRQAEISGDRSLEP